MPVSPADDPAIETTVEDPGHLLPDKVWEKVTADVDKGVEMPLVQDEDEQHAREVEELARQHGYLAVSKEKGA